ncbi:uncharacterized protein LOC115891631 [Sitophilus oryzae]|uniref:Uncharacterized protein LOC115891631 n=1 Tax=Sitophilus oryzae TaxID=7048 RepID=A0A6J2YXU6_SITOR|nr:uncharacterized protein LOC115891631 [Sitophilus oryzae]
MSNLKNAEAKKVLKRNTELTIPKNDPKLSKKPVESKTSLKTFLPSKCPSSKSQSVDFRVPEMQSTLKLSKVIDDIVKPRKTSSALDVDKKKLALDEKVSRKVNFPYTKSVYKDLIPLCTKDKKPQTLLVARNPVYQRDPEPVLENYLEPRKVPSHYYLPPFNRQQRNAKDYVSVTNGLNLYKTIQINENHCD